MAIQLNNSELKAISQNVELREEFLDNLIDQYSDSILRMAYTYVQEKQLAEEITQDVFLTCYNKIHLFKNKASIKTWIYRIVINKSKDQLRKKSLKKFLLRNPHHPDTYGIENKHPESIIVQEFADRKLSDYVISLPPKFKEVIYMHYFEDMKVREISEVLQIKQNTIKTRLNRGRVLLRKMYEEESDEY